MGLPPYPWRIALIVTGCIGIALQDRLRNGPASRRWQEYLFLLLSGGAGAAFGGACDVLVTSRISPEYFTIGKGIAAGEGFHGRVLGLGLLAGFGPGALAGCLFLYLNSRLRPGSPLPWSRLAGLLPVPMVVAVTCGVTLPLLLSDHDLLGFLWTLQHLLPPDRAAAFLRVWWIHCSLYFGGSLGIVASAIYIHGARR